MLYFYNFFAPSFLALPASIFLRKPLAPPTTRLKRITPRFLVPAPDNYSGVTMETWFQRRSGTV